MRILLSSRRFIHASPSSPFLLCLLPLQSTRPLRPLHFHHLHRELPHATMSTSTTTTDTSRPRPPPPPTHVLETALQVQDVVASTKFYKDLLGVEPDLNTVSSIPHCPPFYLPSVSLSPSLFVLANTTSSSLPISHACPPFHSAARHYYSSSSVPPPTTASYQNPVGRSPATAPVTISWHFSIRVTRRGTTPRLSSNSISVSLCRHVPTSTPGRNTWLSLVSISLAPSTGPEVVGASILPIWTVMLARLAVGAFGLITDSERCMYYLGVKTSLSSS